MTTPLTSASARPAARWLEQARQAVEDGLAERLGRLNHHFDGAGLDSIGLLDFGVPRGGWLATHLWNSAARLGIGLR